MEIGGIKIGLPKVGAKADDNKSLANLKEPIKDTFIRHDDNEVRNATSEFESIKKADGSQYDFVNKCVFQKLYKDGLIDVDTVKAFKDTKFDLYNMSSIYQMKKDRKDDKFFDKVFKAMDKIPNGKEATGFKQNVYEPTKEFTLKFEKTSNKLDEIINSNYRTLGKTYKFDADSLDVIEETNSKIEAGLLPRLKTRTFDYRNHTEVNRIDGISADGLSMKKQTVRTNDKDGNLVKEEVMTPSQVKGMFDVEVNYANGKKEQIAKSTYDKKSGITSIKKDMKSADGTRTQFLLEKDTRGNSLIDYKITDKNGKILMGNSQTFEVLDNNHFISSKNGYKYDIQTDDKKLTVKNLHTEKEATIEFKKKFKGNKDELLKLLKTVPGDELFETVDNIKKLNGKDKDKLLDSHYNSWTKNINIGDNLMVFLHELGHSKDYSTAKKKDFLTGENNRLYSGNKYIQKTFIEERKNFNATHSDIEREHVNYFTQAKGHYNGEWGGLAEVVAETNALTNTYTNRDVEILGTRMQYLQQHFPKTIAAIRDAMNWKDDLTAIEYYGA